MKRGRDANPPTVSICMPSYNHARFLPAAIESALAQTFRDFEVVIVDDGSSDGTLEIAQDYAARHPDRIRVLTHPGHENKGISATANLAWSTARGRYISGLPSDDVFYPDKLERQVAYLERHRDVGLVYGYAHIVDTNGERAPGIPSFGVNVTGGGDPLEQLVQSNAIPGMTVLIRRECVERLGGHEEGLVYSDWDYWVRAAADSKVGFMPRPLAMHRDHAKSTSRSATRSEGVDRGLAVVGRLRQRSVEEGGRLAEPRIRAVLEMQLGYLRFCRGHSASASSALQTARRHDPGLVTDARWLGDWMRERLLEPFHPPLDPERCQRFASSVMAAGANAGGASDPPFSVGGWLLAGAAQILPRDHCRRLAREAAGAHLEAAAILYDRRVSPRKARRAALSALRRRPRRLKDRRIVTVLLESSVSERTTRRLRTVKRSLIGYR